VKEVRRESMIKFRKRRWKIERRVVIFRTRIFGIEKIV
jgi:hypothetical protein